MLYTIPRLCTPLPSANVVSTGRAFLPPDGTSAVASLPWTRRMQRSGLEVCSEMKMEALGSSHFGPKFKNKLDALNNISKKPESFLLKTSFPRKRAERILSRPPAAVTCWDGANGSSEASSADQLNPAHEWTKQQTLKPVPLLSCLLHNLRYHVSQASSFLGGCVLHHIKIQTVRRKPQNPHRNDKTYVCKSSDCELPVSGILNEKLQYLYISEKSSSKLLRKVLLIQFRKQRVLARQIQYFTYDFPMFR